MMETDNDLIRRSDLIKAMERVKKYIHADYLHVVDEQINAIPAVKSEPTDEMLEIMIDTYTKYQSPVDRGLSQQMEGMRLALISAGYTTPQAQEYSDEYTISKIDECNSLNVRIKELEGALKEIKEVYAGSEIGKPEYVQEAYVIRLIKQCFDIASIALRTKP